MLGGSNVRGWFPFSKRVWNGRVGGSATLMQAIETGRPCRVRLQGQQSAPREGFKQQRAAGGKKGKGIKNGKWVSVCVCIRFFFLITYTTEIRVGLLQFHLYSQIVWRTRCPEALVGWR